MTAGRPALPRYRADVGLEVEVSARNPDEAAARIDALLVDAGGRLMATIRHANGRLGAPKLTVIAHPGTDDVEEVPR